MAKVNRILTTAVLAGACLTFTGYACAADAGPGGGQPVPPQRNFQQLKKEMVELHKESLAIVQNGLNCMQAAADFRALRECGMQERSAGAQLRQKANAMFSHDRMRRPGSPNGGFGGGPGGRPGNGPAGGAYGGPNGGAPGN